MAFVLDDILLAPCNLVHWLAKELYEHAEEELTDEGVVRQQLLELQMKFELDEISQEEYRKREDVLMGRLEAIKKYKENSANREP